MKVTARIIAATFLCANAPAWAAGLSVEQVENPRASGGWVSDMAGLLSEESRQSLNALVDGLEKKTGVEVAVVTVPDVEGVPKEFATALFNHWRIGKAEANNGLLVLLVTNQRRLEMETGYGLEPLLPDGWLGTMQSQSMVPLFKQGKFGEGLVAGVAAVAHRLTQDPEAAAQGVAVSFAEMPSDTDAGFPLLPVGAAGLTGAAVGGWFWRRQRQRTCPTCKTRMNALDEQADDEHLDAGQRREETLGSANHEVLRCGGCGFMRTLSHWKWLTPYGRCGACGYKTKLTQRTVLIPATTTSYGSMRVDEDCRHCHARRSYTSIIPMISTSSSSSRSSGSSSRGGGSFGGGRSGGGGAGSSW